MNTIKRIRSVEDAYEAMTSVVASGAVPHVDLFHRVLAKVTVPADMRVANKALTLCVERGVSLTEATAASWVGACARAGNLKRALDVLQQSATTRVKPTAAVLVRLLMLAAKAGDMPAATRALAMLNAEAPFPPAGATAAAPAAPAPPPPPPQPAGEVASTAADATAIDTAAPATSTVTTTTSSMTTTIASTMTPRMVHTVMYTLVGMGMLEQAASFIPLLVARTEASIGAATAAAAAAAAAAAEKPAAASTADAGAGAPPPAAEGGGKRVAREVEGAAETLALDLRPAAASSSSAATGKPAHPATTFKLSATLALCDVCKLAARVADAQPDVARGVLAAAEGVLRDKVLAVLVDGASQEQLRRVVEGLRAALPPLAAS